MASRYGPCSVFESDEVLALVMRDSDSDLSEMDSLGEGDEEMSEGSDDATDIEEDGGEWEVRALARGHRQGRQLVWEDVTVFDDLEQTWISPFQQHRRILLDTTNFQPQHYFKLFFPDELFQLIAEQTNLFADQFFYAHSRFPKWTDTDPLEIHAFVALQIAMGLNCKPLVNDYWRKLWLTETKFGNVMSRDRYLLLQSFLHFSNNESRVQRGEEGYSQC